MGFFEALEPGPEAVGQRIGQLALARAAKSSLDLDGRLPQLLSHLRIQIFATRFEGFVELSQDLIERRMIRHAFSSSRFESCSEAIRR
jgi:hypothetical protein